MNQETDPHADKVHMKFLFDRNLDPDKIAEAEPETITLEAHEQLLNAARQEAIAEGKRLRSKEIDAQFASKAGAIETALKAAFTKVDEAIGDHESVSAELAMTIARTLAPNAMARQPTIEIEALLAECVEHLRSTPHLVIRVNDAIVDLAKTQLDPIAAQSNYEGRLIVMGEPDILVGDCRIEWADGSIIRSLNGLDTAVREKVMAYISRHSSPDKG